MSDEHRMDTKPAELSAAVIEQMHAWTCEERAEFMQALAEEFCPRCGDKTQGMRCTCTCTRDDL